MTSREMTYPDGTSRRPSRPWGIFIGLGCLGLSIGPLLVVGLLDLLGVINVGTGLGLGLWFVISFIPALLVFVVGAIYTAVQESRNLKSSASGSAPHR